MKCSYSHRRRAVEVVIHVSAHLLILYIGANSFLFSINFTVGRK